MSRTPAVHDSVEMSRLLLGLVADAGGDARALARQAGVPGWLLGTDRAMVASAHHARLWELAEQALGDPCAGLTAVTRHRVGDLDLYDYLFTSTADVGQALDAAGEYFHLISTNCTLRRERATGDAVTYGYRHVMQGGRGEQLWTQFSIAGFCARIAMVTGRPITPLHIAFAQPPPRSHRPFIEAFGTRRIDFDAPVTTFTLHARDLEVPLPSADPALARILRRYAATLPRPRPADLLGRVREVLAETIENGSPSMDVLARRLAMSRRTLQRRLAEQGTTWRGELETVRRERARQVVQDGPATMSRLARRLGYADPRSARRTLRRWNGQDNGNDENGNDGGDG